VPEFGERTNYFGFVKKDLETAQDEGVSSFDISVKFLLAVLKIS